MSNDEWFDPELQRRMRAAAPPEVDPAQVLEGLRPRMVRAKRRRQATIGGGVAALALVIAGGALALPGDDAPSSLDVVSGPSSSIAGPTSTTPLSTTTSTTVAPAPTTTAGAIAPATTAATATSTTLAAPATRPAAANPPPSTAPVAPTSTRPGTTSSTTAPPPTIAPERRTFTSAGGTLAVIFDGRAMTAPVATPAGGWTVEIGKQDPDDVDVRFRRGAESVRIRVRVVAGALVRDDG